MAAARVFFGCAALPLFNNIDEQMHFDLVLKYSRRHIPSRIERIDRGSAALIALWGSPEFFNAPQAFPDGRVSLPLWDRPKEEAMAPLRERAGIWSRRINLESNHPPVYYGAAGAWYELGRVFGLREAGAIYWIRFMNCAVAALVVWLAWIFAQRSFPKRPTYIWGLPMLAAAFPQDIWYGINSDALSPLLFGAAFFLALENSEAAGLSAASAVLTKWTNLAIVPATVIFWALRRRFSRLELRQVAGFLLPIALWCAWKYANLGELTGDGEKTRLMGWTLTPISDWRSHPLFSFKGAAFFLDSFLKTFWRGELIWHGRRLFAGPLDWFYSISSCVFIAAAAWGIGAERDMKERAAVLGALASLGAVLVSLVWASLRYDFGSTYYPSRAEPFMYSGRLAFGLLLPFLLLYLRGLRKLTPFLTDRMRLGFVAALAVILATASLLPLRGAMSSHYNWFHLPPSFGG
jgi:hypothetical protein